MAEFPKEIAEAILRVMKDVSYVKKDGENEFHKYTYASEKALLDAVRPAMLEHGLVAIPTVQSKPWVDEHGNTHVVVSYWLVHRSGVSCEFPVNIPGCGNDASKNGRIGDKGTYKALTGSYKYFLLKLFGLATGDDDPEMDERDRESRDYDRETGEDRSRTSRGDVIDHRERPRDNMPDMSDARGRIVSITSGREEPRQDDRSEAEEYFKQTLRAIATSRDTEELIAFWKESRDNRRKFLNDAQDDEAYDAYLAKGKKLRDLEG